MPYFTTSHRIALQYSSNRYDMITVLYAPKVARPVSIRESYDTLVRARVLVLKRDCFKK